MPGGITTELKTYQMYINGEWMNSSSRKTFPVYDPSTEEIIAQVPDAGADDVNRAVAAAKAAFEEVPGARAPRRSADVSSSDSRRKSAPTLQLSPNSNAATPASRLWKLSSISTTRPLASNTTAASPLKLSATLIPFPIMR